MDILIAQTTTPHPVNIGWPELISVGGIAGSAIAFVLWFARHVVTVVIPDMMKTHSGVVDKLVGEFRAESKETRQQHSEHVSRLTNAITTAGEKNVEAVDKLCDSITAVQRGHG